MATPYIPVHTLYTDTLTHGRITPEGKCHFGVTRCLTYNKGKRRWQQGARVDISIDRRRYQSARQPGRHAAPARPLSSVAFLAEQEKVRLGVTFKTFSRLTSRRRPFKGRLSQGGGGKRRRVAGKLGANRVLLRWATGDEFGVNCSESNFLIKINITTIGADWDLLLLFHSPSPRLIFSTLQDNLKDSCCFILIGAVM